MWGAIISGGATLLSSWMSSESSESAAADYSDIMQAQLDWQKEIYADWTERAKEVTAPYQAVGEQSLATLFGTEGGTYYSMEMPTEPTKEEYTTGASGKIVNKAQDPGMTKAGTLYLEDGSTVKVDDVYSYGIGETYEGESVFDEEAYTEAYSAYETAMEEYEASAYTTEGTEGLLAAGPGEFEESEGYQWTLSEGLKAIEQSASASHKQLSGETLKDLTSYAEGLASTEYDKFLERYYESLKPYMWAAELGQTSTGQELGYGTSMASSVMSSTGETSESIAEASAAGTTGSTSAWTSALENISSLAGQYSGAQTLSDILQGSSGSTEGGTWSINF